MFEETKTSCPSFEKQMLRYVKQLECILFLSSANVIQFLLNCNYLLELTCANLYNVCRLGRLVSKAIKYWVELFGLACLRVQFGVCYEFIQLCVYSINLSSENRLCLNMVQAQ